MENEKSIIEVLKDKITDVEDWSRMHKDLSCAALVAKTAMDNLANIMVEVDKVLQKEKEITTPKCDIEHGISTFNIDTYYTVGDKVIYNNTKFIYSPAIPVICGDKFELGALSVGVMPTLKNGWKPI